MAKVEANEMRRCDTGCGAVEEVQPGCLLPEGWALVTWRGQRVELCHQCSRAIENIPLMRMALDNAKPGGHYGPDADCA